MTKLVEKSDPNDLAWTKLIDNSNSPSGPVIVKMDEKLKESPQSETIPNGRKSSLLGTFHRHLRMSLKAVSDSPGPITR